MKSDKYVRVEEGIKVWEEDNNNPEYKISNKKIDLVMIGDLCNGKKVINKDEKYIYLNDESKITEEKIITHSACRKI